MSTKTTCRKRVNYFYFDSKKIDNMGKILAIFLLILPFNAILSQSSSIISLDSGRFLNNQSICQRINGVSIPNKNEMKVKEYLHLNTGTRVKTVKEVNNLYMYHIYVSYSNPFPFSTTGDSSGIQTNLYKDQYNSILIGIQFPFNMKTKLSDSKLLLLTGINYGSEYLLSFTEFTGTDPFISSPEQYLRYRKFGFGYNVGLTFEIIPRLGLLGEFVSAHISDFPFNYLVLGMKIKLGEIENKAPGKR